LIAPTSASLSTSASVSVSDRTPPVRIFLSPFEYSNPTNSNLVHPPGSLFQPVVLPVTPKSKIIRVIDHNRDDGKKTQRLNNNTKKYISSNSVPSTCRYIPFSPSSSSVYSLHPELVATPPVDRIQFKLPKKPTKLR
jgi:hypothetical protein